MSISTKRKSNTHRSATLTWLSQGRVQLFHCRIHSGFFGTGHDIPVDFKNVMKFFFCCPYKKRNESRNDEETAIYSILLALEEKQQYVVVLQLVIVLWHGMKKVRIFGELTA